MQVVHQTMVAQVFLTETAGVGIARHPAQGYGVADRVFQIRERLLELIQNAVGRA